MLSVVFFNDPLVLFLTGISLLFLFFYYFATEIESRKRNVGTILLVGIVGLSALGIQQQGLKGGIDIVGGSAFSHTIQQKEGDDGELMPVTPEQVNEAIRVISDRLNSRGTSDPLIARQGDDGIIVQMPGVEPEESEKIREILEKVAKLELREVSPRTDEVGPNGKTLAQRVWDKEAIIPGYRAYELTQKDEDDNEFTRPILLNKRVALGGSDVAFASPSQQRGDAVSVTLSMARELTK